MLGIIKKTKFYIRDRIMIKCDYQPFFLPTFEKLILFAPHLVFSRSASPVRFLGQAPLGAVAPFTNLTWASHGRTRLSLPPVILSTCRPHHCFAAVPFKTALWLSTDVGVGARLPSASVPALPSLADCSVR